MPVEQPSATFFEEPVLAPQAELLSSTETQFEDYSFDSFEEPAVETPRFSSTEESPVLPFSRRSTEELFTIDSVSNMASYGQRTAPDQFQWYVNSEAVREAHPDFYEILGDQTVEYVITTSCDAEGNPQEVVSVEMLLNHDWPGTDTEAALDIESGESFAFSDDYRISVDEAGNKTVEHFDQATQSYVPLEYIEYPSPDPVNARAHFDEFVALLIQAHETEADITQRVMRQSADGSYYYSEITYSFDNGTVNHHTTVEPNLNEDTVREFLADNPDLALFDPLGFEIDRDRFAETVSEEGSGDSDDYDPEEEQTTLRHISDKEEERLSSVQPVVESPGLEWKYSVVEEVVPAESVDQNREPAVEAESVETPQFQWEQNDEARSIEHVSAHYIEDGTEDEAPQEYIAVQAIIRTPEIRDDVPESEEYAPPTVDVEVTISRQPVLQEQPEEQEPEPPVVLYSEITSIAQTEIHTVFQKVIAISSFLPADVPRPEEIPLIVTTQLVDNLPMPQEELEKPVAQNTRSETAVELPPSPSPVTRYEYIPEPLSTQEIAVPAPRVKTDVPKKTLPLLSIQPEIQAPTVVHEEKPSIAADRETTQERIASILQEEKNTERVTLYTSVPQKTAETVAKRAEQVTQHTETSIRELLKERPEEVRRTARGGSGAARPVVTQQALPQTLQDQPNAPRTRRDRHEQAQEAAAAEAPQETNERFAPGIRIRGLANLTPVQQVTAKQMARSMVGTTTQRLPIEFAVIQEGPRFHLQKLERITA